MKATGLFVFLIGTIPIVMGIVFGKALKIPLIVSLAELSFFFILLVIWWKLHQNETFFGYMKR